MRPVFRDHLNYEVMNARVIREGDTVIDRKSRRRVVRTVTRTRVAGQHEIVLLTYDSGDMEAYPATPDSWVRVGVSDGEAIGSTSTNTYR